MTTRTYASWPPLARDLKAGVYVTNAQISGVVRATGRVPSAHVALVADRLVAEPARPAHRPEHDASTRRAKIERESALLTEWLLVTEMYRARGVKAPITSALKSVAKRRNMAVGSLRRMRYEAEKKWTEAERRLVLKPTDTAVTATLQATGKRARK